MMSAATFPSVAWFSALRDRLNSDGDFRHLARWTSARIGFAVTGQLPIVLTIVRGEVVRVDEGEGLLGADYALEGPQDGWDVLFTERGSLPQATNLLHGKLRLRGDLVAAAGDNWTLANLVRRFGR
jgi:hypothetical protein